jgi:hypothetical protein
MRANVVILLLMLCSVAQASDRPHHPRHPPPPLLFADCVCNRSRGNGIVRGDQVSVYFYDQISPATGRVYGVSAKACVGLPPQCPMNNYPYGGFQFLVGLRSSCSGCLYKTTLTGTVQ